MSSIQVLQPYEISLVSYDFTSNETLNDVFYSLETLSVTVEDIFNRIDKRLSGSTIFLNTQIYII